MKTELKNESLFLLTSLCLFYPIGLLILLRSELERKIKWSLGIIGLIVFTGLLSLAFLHPSKPAETTRLQLHVTRETLSVGQTGGFILTDGTVYSSSYTAHSNKDCIHVHGSAYTAVKPGTDTLTVEFEDRRFTVEIAVTDGPGTDLPVLASPTGERYHDPNAKHAGKKAVTMTEEEALLSGKIPCKTCFEK